MPFITLLNGWTFILPYIALNFGSHSSCIFLPHIQSLNFPESIGIVWGGELVDWRLHHAALQGRLCWCQRPGNMKIHKTFKVLNVAEKNDAAKNIANIMSNGAANRRFQDPFKFDLIQSS